MSQVRSLPLNGTRDRSAATPVALRRIAPPLASPNQTAVARDSAAPAQDPLLELPESLPELFVHWGYPQTETKAGHSAQAANASPSPLSENSPQPHQSHRSDLAPASTEDPAPQRSSLPLSQTPPRDPVLEQIAALRQVVRKLQAAVARSSEPSQLHSALLEHQTRDAVRQIQQVVSQVPQEATQQVARLVEHRISRPPSSALARSLESDRSASDRVTVDRAAADHRGRTRDNPRPPIAGIQGLRVVARPSVAAFESSELATNSSDPVKLPPEVAAAPIQRSISPQSIASSSASLSTQNLAPRNLTPLIDCPTSAVMTLDPSDASELFPTPTTLPWHLRVKDGSWWLGILWQAACIASVIGSVLAVPLWMSEKANSPDEAARRTYGSIDSLNQNGLPRARLVELIPERGTRVADRSVAPAKAETSTTTSNPSSSRSLSEPRLVGPLDQAISDTTTTGARR